MRWIKKLAGISEIKTLAEFRKEGLKMSEIQKIRPREEATELLEAYIRKNELPPNAKLPSERELCDMWNLNRTTLRSAIRRLIEEGKLYSQKGSGTYVSERRFERKLQDVKSVTEAVREDRRKLQNVLLDMSITTCDHYIANKLQIAEGTEVFCLKRLRFLDDVPFMIETSFIDYRLCNGIEAIDFSNNSIYEELEKFGIKLSSGQENIGITYADDEEARLLQIKKGTSLFHIAGVSKDLAGNIIEFFQSVSRSDMVKYSSMLVRK